jgi:hypothetical protein
MPADSIGAAIEKAGISARPADSFTMTLHHSCKYEKGQWQLLTLNGPSGRRDRCLLIELKRTDRGRAPTAAFDPSPPFDNRSCCDAQFNIPT